MTSTAIPIHEAKEGVISGERAAAAGEADRFARAWQALRHDPSVQFNLSPPPQPPRPPAWLEAFLRWLGDALEPVGRFLKWIWSFVPDAPYARIFLWTLILIGAAALLWAVYNRLIHGQWALKLPRLAMASELPADEEWAPEETGARFWLEEADALAREGRFGEAIHHLLFRSIDDIANRRPALVRPALTSRELAAAQVIPSKARDLFAGIARLVERNLFAARPAGEKDWLEAREAYSGFALPSAWRS
jgi:hypothetical protein